MCPKPKPKVKTNLIQRSNLSAHCNCNYVKTILKFVLIVLVCFCVTAFQGNVSEQSFHLKEKTLLSDLMETDSHFQFPHNVESHSFTSQTVNLNWHPNVLRQGIILSVRGKCITQSLQLTCTHKGSQKLTDLTFSTAMVIEIVHVFIICLAP